MISPPRTLRSDRRHRRDTDPPRRLAVGSYGLEMVRGKLAELAADYDAWEKVTLGT